MNTVLLLTILSIAPAAVLLIALGIGLFYIALALEGIASSLDKVAYGVRAIETETSLCPLALTASTVRSLPSSADSARSARNSRARTNIWEISREFWASNKL